MSAGSGALGLGSGFAKGFANALLGNRERSDRKKREADAAKVRQFEAVNPVAYKAAEDSGDWAAYEDFLTGHFPDLKKQAKKTGFSFSDLGPLLKGTGSDLARPTATSTAQMTGDTAQATSASAVEQGAEPTGATPSPNAQATAPLLAGRPAVSPAATATPQPPDARSQFLGMTMLTPEQKTQRAVTAQVSSEEQVAQARVGVARRILPILQQTDPSLTMEDAMRYVSKGELMSAASQRAANAATYHYGVDREAISKELFGKDFGALTKPEATIVMREEKSMLEQEANARGTGTAQAKFNAPADLNTARENQVAVGTSAADVKGQLVPTTQQADRRKSVEGSAEQLQHIKKDLLVALPKKGELGALAPGAALAIRRRSPQYRDQVAALESAVNGIVNAMARSVGEQRGGQTEPDALRAEGAIANLHDAFLAGDTQESAAVRIDESLQLLQRLLDRLPSAPTPVKGAVPTATTPAARPTRRRPGELPGTPNGGSSTTPTAKQDANGNWVISTGP